jgi:hypothetical protein
MKSPMLWFMKLGVPRSAWDYVFNDPQMVGLPPAKANRFGGWGGLKRTWGRTFAFFKCWKRLGMEF